MLINDDVTLIDTAQVSLGLGCHITGRLVLRAEQSSSTLEPIDVSLDGAVVEGGVFFDRSMVGANVKVTKSVVGCSMPHPWELVQVGTTAAPPTTTLAPTPQPPPPATPAPTVDPGNHTGSNSSTPSTNLTVSTDPSANVTLPATADSNSTTDAATTTTEPPTPSPPTEPPNTTTAPPTAAPIFELREPYSGYQAGGAGGGATPTASGKTRYGFYVASPLALATISIAFSAMCGIGTAPTYSGANGVASVALNGESQRALLAISGSTLVAERADGATSGVHCSGAASLGTRIVVVETRVRVMSTVTQNVRCAGIDIPRGLHSGAGLTVLDGTAVSVSSEAQQVLGIHVGPSSGAFVDISPRSIVSSAGDTIGGPFGPEAGSSRPIDGLFFASSATSALAAVFPSPAKLSTHGIEISVESGQTQPGLHAGVHFDQLTNCTAILGGAVVTVRSDAPAHGLLVEGAAGGTSVAVGASQLSVSPLRNGGTTAYGFVFKQLQGVAVQFVGVHVFADSMGAVSGFGAYIGPNTETCTIDLMAVALNATALTGAALHFDTLVGSAVSLVRSELRVLDAGPSRGLRIDGAKSSTMMVAFTHIRNFGHSAVQVTYLPGVAAGDQDVSVVFNHARFTSDGQFADAWRGIVRQSFSKCSTVQYAQEPEEPVELIVNATPTVTGCGICSTQTDCAGGVVDVVTAASTLFPPAPTSAPSGGGDTGGGAGGGNGSMPLPGASPAPSATAAPGSGLCTCYACDALVKPPGAKSLYVNEVQATRNATLFCLVRDWNPSVHRANSLPDLPESADLSVVSSNAVLRSALAGWRSVVRFRNLRAAATSSASASLPATESLSASASDTAESTLTLIPPPSRTGSRSRSRNLTASHDVTVSNSVPDTVSASFSAGAPLPPYRSVLARAMNAAGFSDSNAHRISIASSVLLGLSALAVPLAGNKGMNLDRLAASVECHYDPFDEHITNPTLTQVLVPVPIGTGPLRYARGGVLMCIAWMILPQAITYIIMRASPYHYKPRVVAGIVSVACFVYFAGTSTYYATLMVSGGETLGERLAGGLTLLLAFCVVGWPALGLTKVENLYLVFRMYDRGAANYELRSVQLYLFVDVLVSCLLACATAARLPLSKDEFERRNEWRGYGTEAPEDTFTANSLNCSMNAGAGVLICLLYIIYLLVKQPLADRVTLLFVILFAVIQFAVAVVALLSVHFAWALQILGLVALVQLLTIGAMLVLVLAIRAGRLAKLQAMRTAEIFEEDKKAAAGEAERPLLRLPDSDEEDAVQEEERAKEEAEEARRAAFEAKKKSAREAMEREYAGVDVFEEERVMNEKLFGLSPEDLKRREQLEASVETMAPSERRRLHLERLKRKDEEERRMLEDEMPPLELMLARHEERALRNLSRYNSYGYGRSVREVDGELLARWVARQDTDGFGLAALVAERDPRSVSAPATATAMAAGEPHLPPSAHPALVQGTVRELEKDLNERREQSRHARALVIRDARVKLDAYSGRDFDGLRDVLPPPPPGPPPGAPPAAGGPRASESAALQATNPLSQVLETSRRSGSPQFAGGRSQSSRFRPVSSSDDDSDFADKDYAHDLVQMEREAAAPRLNLV